jgi:hypothetical protein
MRTNRKKMITDLIDAARKFRSCGPSSDPDRQTEVTTGYRDLVIQFQRLAGPFLPEEPASRLKSIRRRNR